MLSTQTRSFFTALAAVLALSTVMATPIASAEGTGRFRQCAVEHDSGTVIVIYTVETRVAIADAKRVCGQLSADGTWAQTTRAIDNNPNYYRVCMVTFDPTESLDVFASNFSPTSYAAAGAGCKADESSGYDTYWD
jgi:hypothetical protein